MRADPLSFHVFLVLRRRSSSTRTGSRERGGRSCLGLTRFRFHSLLLCCSLICSVRISFASFVFLVDHYLLSLLRFEAFSSASRVRKRGRRSGKEGRTNEAHQLAPSSRTITISPISSFPSFHPSAFRSFCYAQDRSCARGSR